MERFLKFSDSKGTHILLTKEEVERVNTRLEFSHTIRVQGESASRPLYLQPNEFDAGRRRFSTYGEDAGRILDLRNILRYDSLLRGIRNRSEILLITFLGVGVAAIWFIGGGKAPAIAYATVDLSGEGLGRFLVPAAAAFIALTGTMFAVLARLKKRGGSGGIEVR